MVVSLTPQIEAMIQQRLDSGRYSDASEVVQEALRLLEERDQHQHLRGLLEEGLEEERRGELIDFTPELLEDITRSAHERFLRGEDPDPNVSF